MTVIRFVEIKQLIELGHSDRRIASALNCSRTKVAEIRRGEARDPSIPIIYNGPLWAKEIDWEDVRKDLGYKHPLKFIWEEKAKSVTSYSNFWKIFYRLFPHLRKGLSTPREFEPGERAEVDYAGGKIEWIEKGTGEIHEAVVFVSCLGYSQLIFAWASENMKGRAFLEAHKRMFEFYGGITNVTVPDCTKTAVIKCHIYDPDLNPAFSELARFYKTAIVPARPSRPKDKALVEGAVKIFMRYFRFIYRRHTFISIAEINEAILKTLALINNKEHARFRVSRLNRFEKFEKVALKELPSSPFESVEWKQVVVHPDCTVSIDFDYYSAPHELRGKTLQARISENLIELFSENQRVALHKRSRGHKGKRNLDSNHFPENAKAYMEATPKNILSSARFLSPDLHKFIDDLFQKDTHAYIRISQGFISAAKKHINEVGKIEAEKNIQKAIETMRSFNRFRVAYFRELLTYYRKQIINTEEREIKRKPGNPMLRYSESKEKNRFNCLQIDAINSFRGNDTPENNQLLFPMMEANNQGSNK